jgi:hypothetical protein
MERVCLALDARAAQNERVYQAVDEEADGSYRQYNSHKDASHFEPMKELIVINLNARLSVLASFGGGRATGR